MSAPWISMFGLCACTASNPEAPAEPDADGDGWRVSNGDCDDENPEAYPGAPEVCDDGVDQNCSPHGCILPLEGWVDQVATVTFPLGGFGDIQGVWLGSWGPHAFYTAWDHTITRWALPAGTQTTVTTPLGPPPEEEFYGMYLQHLGNDLVLLQGYDDDGNFGSYVVQTGTDAGWGGAVRLERPRLAGDLGEPLSERETLLMAASEGDAFRCDADRCAPAADVAVPSDRLGWRAIALIRFGDGTLLAYEARDGVDLWDVERGALLSHIDDPEAGMGFYSQDSSVAVGSFDGVHSRLVLGTWDGAVVVDPASGETIVVKTPFGRWGSPNLAVFDADLDGFDDLFFWGVNDKGGYLAGYGGDELDTDLGPEAIRWKFDVPDATRVSIGAADLDGDGDADLAIADQAGERMFGLLARRD